VTINGQAKNGETTPPPQQTVTFKRYLQIIPGLMNRAIYIDIGVDEAGNQKDHVIGTIDIVSPRIDLIGVMLRDLADEIDRQVALMVQMQAEAAKRPQIINPNQNLAPGALDRALAAIRGKNHR
jgi:hypothetical protein